MPGRPSRGGALQRRILIVKLGAFGNVILSLSAFPAIRQHHAEARISVLTSPAYADWLRTFPYFDEVLVDPRPAWWDLPAARRLGRMLATANSAGSTTCRRQAARPATFACSRPNNGRTGRGSRSAARCRTAIRNATNCMMPPRQEGQLRQAGLTSSRPRTCPGARRHRPVRPAAPFRVARPRKFARTGWQNDGLRIGLPHWRPALAERGITRWCLDGAGAPAGGADSCCGRPDRPNQLRRPCGIGPRRAIRGWQRYGADAFARRRRVSRHYPVLGRLRPSSCAPRGRWTRVLRRPVLADLPVERSSPSVPDRVAA